jgi:hypothetical protein
MPRPRSYSTTSSNSTFSVNTLSSLPSDSRPPSGPHTRHATASQNEQEMALGSMYDYLVKFILIGPSGTGKSCLLHRFIKEEWKPLSSHTIGVEFANKLIKLGSGARRKRMKLQVRPPRLPIWVVCVGVGTELIVVVGYGGTGTVSVRDEELLSRCSRCLTSLRHHKVSPRCPVPCSASLDFRRSNQ